MDIEFEANRTLFVWNMEKAAENLARHGVELTEAATVFDDWLLVITDATRNGESRDKVIGFSCTGRLLAVIHSEHDDEFIRIISAWPATASETDLYDQRP